MRVFLHLCLKVSVENVCWFVCFSTVYMSFIYICLDLQKVPPGFFSRLSHLWLVRYSTMFFLLRCFQYKKKILTSCIRQKTKRNKTKQTRQQKNKQANKKTCVHMLQPMFFMTLQKATLLMSILAVAWRNRLDSVSDYYTKDKS